MTKNFRRLMLGIFTIATVFTSEIYADTFEFLTYTPPPGWTKQMSADGPVYRRASGVGLISFYASYPTTNAAADEFARTWRTRIESALNLPAPQPKIESDGDYRIAVGAQNVDAQGTMTAVSLVTIVGRGRAISFSAVAAGADVLSEFTSFLDTIKITPGTTAASATGTIDVDFDVPKGYTSTRDGSAIVLKPASIDRNTPCIYGLSPTRASSGVLEADARAAILEALPGWQLKSEHYNAMRGTAAAGWPYFWFRTDVQQMSGASMQYLSAMAMAFPGGPGRTNILWGFGPPAQCMLNDIAFVRLFHSLRPRGWTSDGGKAFANELVGTWRNTEASGMAQYRFLPNGKYEYGQGTSTTFGTLETRTGSVGEGSYAIRGSELTLTGGRRAGRYLVRVYDEFGGGLWLKTISILSDGATPLEVRYLKVN